MNVNINLMVENVIQIKSEIMINVDASVNIVCVKKNVFGILLHVVVNNGKYLANIIDASVITCHEVIE